VLQCWYAEDSEGNARQEEGEEIAVRLPPFEPSPRHKFVGGIAGVSMLLFGVVGIVGNGGLGQIRHDNAATQIGWAGFVVCWLIFMATIFHAYFTKDD
jgi:hypothetical protein